MSESRWFLLAYLAQLLVPLFFMADIVAAWRFNGGAWWHTFSITGQLIFTLSALWLLLGTIVLGLALLFWPLNFYKLRKPIVSLYAVIVVVSLVELILVIAPSVDPAPALWPPGLEVQLATDSDSLPGIRAGHSFSGNNVGLRGPDLEDGGNKFKIVAIGGSTTQNLVLEDTKAWTFLTAQALNQGQSREVVWIGNGGQSGPNTLDYLASMRSLPVVREADMLIF